MYRQMSTMIIYCPLWPCERQCGLFHLEFINTTKYRPSKSTSSTVPSTSKGSEEQDLSRRSTHNSVLDDIMEMAARKVSDSYKEAPMPKLGETLANKRKNFRQVPSISMDTTTIHFDCPVWDNATLRRDLLDSDEELLMQGDPPSDIDDDLTADEIIKLSKLNSHWNPIDHEMKDEMIIDESDDENDYSLLDLTQQRKFSIESTTEVPVRKRISSPGVKYEESLDVS